MSLLLAAGSARNRHRWWPMPAAMPMPDTFTPRVFALARALDILRHALVTDDAELAILAGAQARAEVAALERAYADLPAHDRAEADLLVGHVRARAEDVLATTPTQLPGLYAIRAFLHRFAPR